MRKKTRQRRHTRGGAMKDNAKKAGRLKEDNAWQRQCVRERVTRWRCMTGKGAARDRRVARGNATESTHGERASRRAYMWEKGISQRRKEEKRKDKQVDCSVARASQKGTARVDSRKAGAPQREGVPVHL
jgi:hypothetical protein